MLVVVGSGCGMIDFWLGGVLGYCWCLVAIVAFGCQWLRVGFVVVSGWLLVRFVRFVCCSVYLLPGGLFALRMVLDLFVVDLGVERVWLWCVDWFGLLG